MRGHRLVGIALVAVVGAGCAGLNARQEEGWLAFHACVTSAPTASMEDLSPGGRVNYYTSEGSEFGVMKGCMEERGYQCDLGLTIGTRPHTHCYPRTG